jgi:glycosyltransferase involved in cell wall biosynthesis
VPHNDFGRPSTFGYFGNVSPFKGTIVAIEAARQLHAAGKNEVRLKIHGSPLFQSDAFKKDFAEALFQARGYVTHHGPYRPDEIPTLMAGLDWVVMPSIWWENAPLVIQEAFQQKRPVICSGIGGMAEMVEDGISGLHFRPGDPASLADAMLRAITEPGLRERLVAGIPQVPTMKDTAQDHASLYRDLLRRSIPAAA